MEKQGVIEPGVTPADNDGQLDLVKAAADDLEAIEGLADSRVDRVVDEAVDMMRPRPTS